MPFPATLSFVKVEPNVKTERLVGEGVRRDVVLLFSLNIKTLMHHFTSEGLFFFEALIVKRVWISLFIYKFAHQKGR
ncbi:unknown [Porphyromonas sp. CAG:1061]|nr:unknown [Porphyromonas sp. CAG:1061]